MDSGWVFARCRACSQRSPRSPAGVGSRPAIPYPFLIPYSLFRIPYSVFTARRGEGPFLGAPQLLALMACAGGRAGRSRLGLRTGLAAHQNEARLVATSNSEAICVMDTIVITGGAGFIGSCLVRHMVAQQVARIVTLDKLTYAGNLDSLEPVMDAAGHVFVQGDIADGPAVQELLHAYRPRAIINLAAESHVDRSIDGPAEFVQTNVVGTFRLLEVVRRYWGQLSDDAREAFRFLHVSTDEVYGSLGETGAFTETSPYAPNSPYSASKAASDHFVRAYFHTYGLPVLVTNCSNNYGPYQFPEKLIPLMILSAIEGKPLPVYGDGLNVRDWLHVEDHCRALQLVLDRGVPGNQYNIGGNCERTNVEVVQSICRTIDQLCPNLRHRPCSDLITFVRDRPGHDRRYAIDSSRIRRELGWRPQRDFETGLAETAQWYLSNSTWVQRVTSGVYQRERLGLAQSQAAVAHCAG